MKKRHNEEQIIYALKRLETGSKGLAGGVPGNGKSANRRCITGSGSTAGFMIELQRLKQLEEEKRKLKQLVADLSLDKHILQEVVGKKL